MESGEKPKGQRVFERLYSEARLRSLKRPVSASQLDCYMRNNAASKIPIPHSKPQTTHNQSTSTPKNPSETLIPHPQTSGASKPVLHCYVNLSLSQSQEPVLSSRPVTALQSPRVVVTAAQAASQRLELRPVHPEIPEGGTMLSNYERLLRGQGRRGTEVIVTPHYAQLTPVVNAYSFKAGCHMAEWVKRSKPSVWPSSLHVPR